jgi:hypothetical protein
MSDWRTRTSKEFAGSCDMAEKRVYIVGGNGFARECYGNLLRMIATDSSIQFGGFLGHGGYGHTVDYKDLQKYYSGEVSEHIFKEDEYVVIGAGYPELRKKIYADLKKLNVRFFTIYIGEKLPKSIEIGESNIFAPPFVCSCNIKIGNNNKIAPLSAVYKGCRDNSYWVGNPAVKVGSIE